MVGRQVEGSHTNGSYGRIFQSWEISEMETARRSGDRRRKELVRRVGRGVNRWGPNTPMHGSSITAMVAAGGRRRTPREWALRGLKS